MPDSDSDCDKEIKLEGIWNKEIAVLLQDAGEDNGQPSTRNKDKENNPPEIYDEVNDDEESF